MLTSVDFTGRLIKEASWNIIRVKEELERNADPQDGWERRIGGWFCVIDTENCEVILEVKLGVILPKESERCRPPNEPLPRSLKYRDLARAKAVRLLENFRVYGHMASYEDRLIRPTDPIPGGAIIGKRYIYSFSGYPAAPDSIAMVLTAQQAEELTPAEVLERARRAGVEVPMRLFLQAK